MSSTRTRSRLFPLAGLILAGASWTAEAATYPTNVCVGSKQTAAANYCQRVLKAWAAWDGNQDAGKRDASLATAASKLAADWSKAEAKSAAKGADCTDTTLSAGAAQSAVDGVVASIVASVNGGLTLATKDHAKCGKKALTAAAAKCAGLLKAESAFVKALAKDPGGHKRDAKQAKVRDKFSAAFAKATATACPTTATAGGIEQLVDSATGALVRDTEISPNVDDAQFTTITPGTTSYEGRTLNPTCMNGSPYAYFVKRGTVNKLVMYYQGGGACWDQLTCSFPACDTNVNVSGGDNPNNNLPRPGFADLTNPDNPFKDWNIVFVSYCSCDIHFGDAAQDYPLHVEHRGFHNAKVAEKWAREHFVAPETVFVTGSSAGAYGAWFHGPLLHDVWPASQFHVLADAGNGVITQDFLDNYFPNWNFAGNLPPKYPQLQAVLADGSGIPGYTKVVTDLFPDTTWAHYTSAFDGGQGGQTSFYNIMITGNNPVNGLTWWTGSCAFNTQMQVQLADTVSGNPHNYRYYVGTGSRHTMWGSNKVYADTTGGVPPLVDWINAMLASGNGMNDPDWTNVQCTDCGLLLPGDPRPNPLVAPFEQQGADVRVVCSASGAFVD